MPMDQVVEPPEIQAADRDLPDLRAREPQADQLAVLLGPELAVAVELDELKRPAPLGPQQAMQRVDGLVRRPRMGLVRGFRVGQQLVVVGVGLGLRGAAREDSVQKAVTGGRASN
jgi:hypothetical protein